MAASKAASTVTAAFLIFPGDAGEGGIEALEMLDWQHVQLGRVPTSRISSRICETIYKRDLLFD
jgi:hypothetical protein